jgi:hypothetical protein
METLTNITIGIGIFSFLGAAGLRLYAFAYGRGYADGKHAGFSEGLWAAARRRNRANDREEYWVT